MGRLEKMCSYMELIQWLAKLASIVYPYFLQSKVYLDSPLVIAGCM